MVQKDGLARVTQQWVQKAGQDFSTEISYAVGNATDQAIKYGDKIDQMSRGTVALESARALGSTAYQAAEDIVRNDKICAGACLVASACEVIAGTSAMIKYPGALKVYFVSKSISIACIRFRNLCKNAKGEIRPC